MKTIAKIFVAFLEKVNFNAEIFNLFWNQIIDWKFMIVSIEINKIELPTYVTWP